MRNPEDKIISREETVQRRRQLREDGKAVAFTNGCFDVLHAGHANLLAFARRQGDVLIVGINSDRSVRSIKGERRPIVPQQERALLLASLEAVDFVIIFDEERVDSLIEAVLPDVLVKGAQWGSEVHGREHVEKNGGRVVLAPMTEGRSTTDIIATVLRLHRGHEIAD